MSTLIIDAVPYKTRKKKMIGAEIKAMSGIDAHYTLYLESDDGDKPIGDLQSFVVESHMRFYAVPSCTGA